jgi:hypothetical protein
MADTKLEISGLAPVEITAIEPAVEYFIEPEEDKKVLWKIDRVVMPIMMIVLFFQCTPPLCVLEDMCKLLTAPRPRQAVHQLRHGLQHERRPESHRG